MLIMMKVVTSLLCLVLVFCVYQVRQNDVETYYSSDNIENVDNEDGIIKLISTISFPASIMILSIM